MPRSENQKFKILYLMRMFLERTDSSHVITMQEILAELERQGIRAERKSIYHDIETLRRFGMDIAMRKGAPAGYCLVSREFALAELKLLVDALQAAPFISEESCEILQRKLERLASCHEAAALHRPVYRTRKARGAAQNLCFHMDRIQEAMLADTSISFQYFTWTVDKKPKLKRDGGRYEVSPWCLAWEGERSYLAAYEHNGKKVKLYRVDQMINLELTDNPRLGRAAFDAFDLPDYRNKTFGMAEGDERMLTLRMDHALAGAVLDQFGMDITMRPSGKDTFQIKVPVKVSPQFYGWLTGLGKGARIVSPQDEAENYRKYLKRLLKEYK